MTYTIQHVQEKLSIVADDIKKFIKSNNIKIGKNGTLSEKSYQMVLKFYTIDDHKLNLKVNGNSIYTPSINTVFTKQNHFFETEDKRITIFQDDAIVFLKTLNSNSIDLIITDPAYSGMNQRLKLGRGKIIGKYSDAGKNGAKWFEEFHDTEENYKAFLQECYRVLKNNRHIYIMYDSYSLLSLAHIARDVFDVKNVLCWDKANIGLGHYFRRRHEFILFASKGKRNLNSKSIPDVWKIKRVVNSQYPAQKPTEVFELMLKGSSEKNFVVCDPFVGSGSSMIACIKTGCKFIGSDISEKAFLVSKERAQIFLKTGSDPFQKQSLLGDDEAIIKLFINGKPK